MREQMPETGDWRWFAVANRKAEFDGAFYFAVRTTGVFCKPSCASRRPRRENVAFYDSVSEAEAGGFRPCLRCRPTVDIAMDSGAETVAAALRLLEREDGEGLTVAGLSEAVGVTPGHLQKLFRRILGASPKRVLDAARLDAFKRRAAGEEIVTSLYESGFGSSRALYEKAAERLGMTPKAYKKGGKDMKIRYTIIETEIGQMAIAATEKGICSVSLGETDAELRKELEAEFFSAEIVRDDGALAGPAKAIVAGLAGERTILTLPLDVRASAFQIRVWSELRKIPYGETRSYKQVAENIGSPRSVRAVARACATNPVAIVTPCHRVVGSDGRLSGYRWGIDRKEKILKKEHENSVKVSKRGA